MGRKGYFTLVNRSPCEKPINTFVITWDSPSSKTFAKVLHEHWFKIVSGLQLCITPGCISPRV